MAKRGAAGRSVPPQKSLERDALPAGAEMDEGLFFNRELSWLAFNDRVLQLAESADEPLLERLKFVAIYARNLDEFFMIRVARLHEQVRANVARLVPDGAAPGNTLDKLHEGIFEQSKRHSAIFEKLLRPALAEKGLRILNAKELDADQRAQVDQRFREQIFPVLTPLAIGLGRHFPYISNLSLSLAVLLRDPEAGEESVARVKVPKELLPRFLPLKNNVFVPLEEVIAQHLGDLFPGMEVLSWSLFRVTRDADFTVSEDAEDLLKAVETELRQRRFGDVIRLEVQAGMSPKLLEPLVEALGLESRQVYEEQGLLGLGDVQAIAFAPGFPELKDPPWVSVTQPRLRPDTDSPEGVTVMAAMRRGDLLVHHPYDSFASSVERFVTEAVADPDVLAIKQTVYRTSDSSPLVPALITATENGKQAVCMVELKARFDERTNIKWANALEEAGVHVVYGIPSLKTHAKAILIVRREGERVRHYVHIGTGNYNPKTARLYTDMGLFTTDPDIGADVADLFNYLTGFGRPKSFRKLLVAPLTMREGLLEHIKRTVVAHTLERPSRIQMKMNALVDPGIIRALYDASRAGVKVELNVRGICCLRPGVPGISENIRVVSTLGRFLEHARVYIFERGTELRCYIGSADLMPRNLDHRVEILAPVEDTTLAAQVRDSLERSLADNTHAWELQADGAWRRLTPPAGAEKRWAQGEVMERATRLAQFQGGRPLP
ncbi:polyphosphate kinase 1 [Myxococcus sp. CA051A]|uniref:polyphosphate kinase 1 n=1 Tax=unclassified Myxococcus TaxID=2648731 RepID=UPI00157AF4F7|nr:MULTISPECIES: polyphosphate kinase 1 [unclassified Myxococcus]NTX10471.1 polyphosphate kinase 1 [Myxococcus sp. CA056]NTX38107.1 polyphosphate kinase 1 [Myxococcus sp. CA033]NTX51150.1 polyphosphate kinase 1 [Myxococcus sp. CA039A]NTX63260.1 polyphosphate kinase 1 [Myxococcus sp. CA051A]